MYLVRYPNEAGTPGDLIIDRKIFCHTLEDILRPVTDKKIYGETAIPAGRYPVELEFSNHFQKILPRIRNVPGFEGVLLHGGNTTKDTLGCILIAYHVAGTNVIQGSASEELVDLLKKEVEPNWIEIFNTYPYVGTK